MPEEADWSLATWEGSRKRQHQVFYALPFREKLKVLEELDGVTRAFGAQWNSRDHEPAEKGRSVMHCDRQLLDQACRRIHARMLILFGSHAPGGLTPRPESDVDLAVAFERDAPRPSYLELFDALADAFPENTPDPVRIADADPLFRWEIMDRGVLLYGQVDDFLELRAFAYRDYVDAADLRELERVLFEKKMARVGERLRAAS